MITFIIMFPSFSHDVPSEPWPFAKGELTGPLPRGAAGVLDFEDGTLVTIGIL